MSKKIKSIDLSNMKPLFVLLILCLLMAIMSSVFLTYSNLINILQQVTINAILALGMSVVIFTGGIDLSVGAVLAVSGIIMGKMMVEWNVSPIIAILCAVLIGAIFGSINGFLISICKLQPILPHLAF